MAKQKTSSMPNAPLDSRDGATTNGGRKHTQGSPPSATSAQDATGTGPKVGGRSSHASSDGRKASDQTGPPQYKSKASEGLTAPSGVLSGRPRLGHPTTMKNADSDGDRHSTLLGAPPDTSEKPGKTSPTNTPRVPPEAQKGITVRGVRDPSVARAEAGSEEFSGGLMLRQDCMPVPATAGSKDVCGGSRNEEDRIAEETRESLSLRSSDQAVWTNTEHDAKNEEDLGDGEVGLTSSKTGDTDWSITVQREDSPNSEATGRSSLIAYAANALDQLLVGQETNKETSATPQPKEGLVGILAKKRQSAGRLMSVSRSVQGMGMLGHLHEKYLKVQADYNRELAVLRAKYEAKFKPIFEERKLALLSHPGDINTGADSSSVGTKLIPGFWLQAFLNNEVLAGAIEPQDEDLLWYLEHVESEWDDATQASGSFTLTFTFSENPHFDQKVLAKKFVLSQAPNDIDSMELRETIGTPISWKHEAVNVTQLVIHRKQRNRRTKETRTITEISARKSFFNFFQSRKLPESGKLDEGTTENDELQQARAAEEYDIAVMIRDDIVPRALNWYLGLYHDPNASTDSSESDSSGSDNDSEFSDEMPEKKERRESSAGWFL